jgi:hypothetical protein
VADRPASVLSTAVGHMYSAKAMRGRRVRASSLLAQFLQPRAVRRRVLQSVPRGMDREQASRVFSSMADAVAELPLDPWTEDEWKCIASILESYAEVGSMLWVERGRMYSSIASRFVEHKPAMHGRLLVQFARAYAAGPYADADATKVTWEMVQADMDGHGAMVVADVAQELSYHGAAWAPYIETAMRWILNTTGEPPNEVLPGFTHACQLSVLAHACCVALAMHWRLLNAMRVQLCP